jgi:putative toxin-antitoxin system antitoxin component (TIGR02293 family)
MPHTALATVPLKNYLQIDEMVREGIPAKMLRDIATRLKLDRNVLADAVRIPRRTLERRLASNTQLRFDEGERAVRIARLLAKADEIFEDREEAELWFVERQDVLGQRSPLELCGTEAGARAVEQVLKRIDEGVFA